MSSIRNLANSLSKVVKRQRLKSESAAHQNSPANTYLNGRLSQRRVSSFDDTWIRPYEAGIARANDMKTSALISYERYEGIYEEQKKSYDNTEHQKDDLDIIFRLSSFDQSRDELYDEVAYINTENQFSEVNSIVSATSEDEISLYCDALSRKSSFVRTVVIARSDILKELNP